MEFIRYKLSKDGKGLLAYTKEKYVSYYIRPSELSPLEKWIRKLLRKLDRYV